MERFMSKEELEEFDAKYQSSKVPTANNLGQKTFEQLVSEKVREEMKKLRADLARKK